MLEQLDPSDRDLLAAASAIGQEFSVAAAAGARVSVPRKTWTRGATRSRAWDASSSRRRAVAGRHSLRSVPLCHDLHRESSTTPPPRPTRGDPPANRQPPGPLSEIDRGDGSELADHFVRAGDAARAVPSLRLAAEQAVERLAHREALDNVTTALAMIDRVPDGPDRWSRSSRSSRCSARRTLRPGVVRRGSRTAFLRARELAERLGNPVDLARTLFRLRNLYEVEASSNARKH